MIMVIFDKCLRMESAFPSLLEGDDSPADLYPLLDPGHLQQQVILPDQCSKFAFIVKNKVFVPHFVYPRVVPGNTDIGDSDFAFMASSYFDAIVGYVLDNHHVVGFLRYAFEHEVLTCWFFNGHKLVLYIVFLNKTRVLFLADLTIEFLEIVLDGAPNHLLLYFGLVPLLQTLEMHQTTSSTAFARLTKKLSFPSALTDHAVFALKCL